MASWKLVIYASIALTIFILFLILNFAYLPRRKLSEESSLSIHSSLKTEKTTNVSPTSTADLKVRSPFLSIQVKCRVMRCSSQVYTKHLCSKSIGDCYKRRIMAVFRSSLRDYYRSEGVSNFNVFIVSYFKTPLQRWWLHVAVAEGVE